MSESWKYEKLGKLCKTGAGGTPLKSKKEYYENGNIPWLRSGEVNNRNIVDCEIKITKEGLNNSSAKLFPPRTVLIAMYGATAGQVGILNFECSTNQAVCGILPNELFIPEFLYYRFLAGQEELIKQAVGGAQPNISQEKIKNTLVPKIPLPEQKQIVSILDKAFAAIDQAKANIERNIENAKELFQSKLNEIFSQPARPSGGKGDGWLSKQVKDFGVVQTGTTPSTKEPENYDDFIPFVKPAHFNTDGSVESGDSMLSEIGLKKGRLFKANSVLMVCIGATIGKTGFVTYDVSSNQQINALTPFDKFIPKVFYYAMISNGFQRQVMSEGKGAQATLPIINKTKWENLFLNIPEDLSVQKKTISILDALRKKTVELQKTYENKLFELEELKKSILQKAFVGELTERTINLEKLDSSAEHCQNMATEPVEQYQAKR